MINKLLRAALLGTALLGAALLGTALLGLGTAAAQAPALSCAQHLSKNKLKASKSTKALLGNNGSRKFLKLSGASNVSLDEAKLQAEALWDGLSGVVTNVTDMTPEQIFSHRAGLWQVEETFRVTKHDLQIRPIYHWTPRRIKAHIAMAFMCLLCVRHLEYRVKMQFEKMSPKSIIRHLVAVQHSIVKHLHTKKRYSIPSKMSFEAVKILLGYGKRISVR